MRRMMFLATGLAVVLGGFASSALAADHGAIAYDRSNCAWGRSWNYPDQRGADDRALSECASGGSNCQVVARMGPGECGAVAATGSCSGFGWATRSTISEARRSSRCSNAATTTRTSIARSKPASAAGGKAPRRQRRQGHGSGCRGLQQGCAGKVLGLRAFATIAHITSSPRHT
jgi:hypothetical protein